MKLAIGLFLSLLVLAGCSTAPQKSSSSEPAVFSWQEHFKNISNIQQWDASAKIAIKVKGKTQSAKMIWLQQNNNYQIEFSGPFGHAGPKLHGDAKMATLLIPKEQPIKGNNTSELLQKRLGWQLPVENAKFWILGIPSPLSESKVTLKEERLTTLQQDGWTINYPKYKTVDNHPLPAKIILTKEDLRLLLIIYKWKINAQPVNS
ncbi:MAG: hypothetical protein OFPII_19540 [Osedax symbiont Rs1]|nr:MAG: hypothetical protein OFPII_19540 [Osedax symbiont Rs1]